LAGGRGGERRCLALKAEELPKLNQLWREHSPEGRTRTCLSSMRGRARFCLQRRRSEGRQEREPTLTMVLSAPPHPWRKIDANMEDKIEVLSIDLVDDRGQSSKS
jgi:hypothetical protein